MRKLLLGALLIAALTACDTTTPDADHLLAAVYAPITTVSGVLPGEPGPYAALLSWPLTYVGGDGVMPGGSGETFVPFEVNPDGSLEVTLPESATFPWPEQMTCPFEGHSWLSWVATFSGPPVDGVYPSQATHHAFGVGDDVLGIFWYSPTDARVTCTLGEGGLFHDDPAALERFDLRLRAGWNSATAHFSDSGAVVVSGAPEGATWEQGWP